jgi:23S rRNA (adenine2503-C2)-methyltransferase
VNVDLRHIPVKRLIDKKAYEVPVLSINTTGQRILSIPTQIGCPVKCKFCVSSEQPFGRNLTADEMVRLVTAHAPGEPFLLSFTGEGEVTANIPNVTKVVEQLSRSGLPIGGLRFSTSGLAPWRIKELPTHQYLTELQISLHAADLEKRANIMCDTPHALYLATYVSLCEEKFCNIRINYVLQAGLNDSEDDIAGLAAWGDRKWSITLNPLLTSNGAIVHERVDEIADQLRAAGRMVHVFKSVGQELCDADIYTNLTYKS